MRFGGKKTIKGIIIELYLSAELEFSQLEVIKNKLKKQGYNYFTKYYE